MSDVAKLTVRVAPSTLDQLDAMAAVEGLTRADPVRRALARLLDGQPLPRQTPISEGEFEGGELPAVVLLPPGQVDDG